MKKPATRLAYGAHPGRGFVVTDELKAGDHEVKRSSYTGAEYEITLSKIDMGTDKTPTASIEITRSDRDGEKETQTAELVGWTAPKTYSEVLKDHNDAQQSGAAHGPRRVVALPFKGNREYAVVAYASISSPGTLGMLIGKTPTAKLYVSEGKLEAPLNYAAFE